jgi:hypothetical protein
MEVLRQLMKKPTGADSLAIGLFVLATLYAIVRGTAHTVLAGIAFALMVLGALPRQFALACLVGASVIVLLQTRRSTEGFESGSATDVSGSDVTADVSGDAAPDVSGSDVAEKPVVPEAFRGGEKPMLPDNATRREPLVLGKPYTLPSESDDKGYHLDAGTTFLNAYKALKPDQIAAMTRDTQELLATQKSLVAMLDSFAPLMKDMNKITGMTGMFGGK